MFAYLQQDGIYVNERFLHAFASCIVSITVMCFFKAELAIAHM